MHSLNTREKTGIKRSSASAIYRIQKAYDSLRKEVLYNILIEFVIPMKLARLIKMYLTEKYSRVRVEKHFSDMFTVRNGLKQGDALLSLL